MTVMNLLHVLSLICNMIDKRLGAHDCIHSNPNTCVMYRLVLVFPPPLQSAQSKDRSTLTVSTHVFLALVHVKNLK